MCIRDRYYVSAGLAVTAEGPRKLARLSAKLLGSRERLARMQAAGQMCIRDRPQAAQGKIFAFGLTEASGGSDAAAIKSTVVPAADGGPLCPLYPFS